MSEESSDESQSTGKMDLEGDSAAQTDHLEGTKLSNRYLLDKLIDRGGFGGVYSGIDIRFDSEVAIKVLTPPFSDHEFRREAQLTRKFNHPNVVQVYDFGIDRGLGFIVMEFLRGDRVDQLFRLKYERLFPPELLDKFVYEMTSALQNAHKQSLIHRDLKPQNVMLIDEGKPTERFVLLDFGIAAQTDATNTLRNATRDTAFTPNYGAPERFNGDPTDHRTDIYSFGTILYELVTGCLPFSEERLLQLMQTVLNDPPPPFEEVAPHVKDCKELEKLIMSCLAKDPADRPQSMEDVREGYFAARQMQMTSPADRARFVDQWNPDTSSHSTTDLSPGFGDTSPTIDLPADTNRDMWADLWDKEQQQTAAQQDLRKAVSTYRRRLLLTIIAAVGVTAAVAYAMVTMFPNQGPGPTRSPWLPSADFRPVKKAGLHDREINGHPVYKKIERIIPGVAPVIFILVDDSERGSPAVPFYIMQNEVWNGLFGSFAEENPKLIKRDEKNGPGIWEDGAMKDGENLGVTNLQLPVVNVSVGEAHECAQWLGGRLPTVVEWNTAAGYYRRDLKASDEEAERLGPFQGKWPAESSQQPIIAIGDHGPLEVGTAEHDISPFGCRDMAGNAEELTCELTGKLGFVPADNPDSLTYVLRRGKSYRDFDPYLYSEFADPNVQGYTEATPFVGFRVVVEIK